jgi:DNA-binding transcriptional regulator LsrR (DeoR family)
MRDFKEGLGKKEREILERYYVNGEAEESIAKEVGMTRYKVRKSIAALHRMMQRHVRNHGLG